MRYLRICNRGDFLALQLMLKDSISKGSEGLPPETEAEAFSEFDLQKG